MLYLPCERQEKVKKIYYSISEVSRLTGLEAHVLRFWETQFPQLKPDKTPGNVRRYRQEDIELIQRIKFLLYTEEYTIPGARKKLKGGKSDLSRLAAAIRQEVEEILKLMS